MIDLLLSFKNYSPEVSGLVFGCQEYHSLRTSQNHFIHVRSSIEASKLLPSSCSLASTSYHSHPLLYRPILWLRVQS